MAVFLWIVGILALLTALLCATRMGATVHFGEHLTLDLRLGLLRFHLDPSRPKKAKKKKAPEKPKKKPAEPKQIKFPKLTAEDLKDAWRTLGPASKRALLRTKRGIRLDPLEVSVVLGGPDPARLAQLYGLCSAALWTLLPALEQLLDIPDPRIRLDLDFDRPSPWAQGDVGLSVRLGALLGAGFSLIFPTLGWLLRCRRRRRAAPPDTGTPGPAEENRQNKPSAA